MLLRNSHEIVIYFSLQITDYIDHSRMMKEVKKNVKYRLRTLNY